MSSEENDSFDLAQPSPSASPPAKHRKLNNNETGSFCSNNSAAHTIMNSVSCLVQ